MPSIEIRPAIAGDLPRLMAMDHSCQSDYVWQLELKRETGQVNANFREVRLPRSVEVKYPRDPFTLGDEWMKRDLVLAAVQESRPVGYLSAMENLASAMVWVTDLVVAPEQRRQGVGSALLNAAQEWALERGARRLVIEMQSKNQACIRMAQKYGYEFCGYNDQYYPTQDVALFFGRGLR
jgi:GNAT superfamily N-acetyltransferase